MANNSAISHRLTKEKRYGSEITVSKTFLMKFSISKTFRSVEIELKVVNKCSIKDRAC